MTRQPTPAEARVLACIAGNPGRLTTAWDICADGRIKSDASVRVLVHRLRYQCGYRIEAQIGPRGGYRLMDGSPAPVRSPVRDRIGHLHAARRAKAIEHQAMIDAAAALAPAILAVAAKHGCKPSTVARIAVCRAQAA